MRPLIPGNLPRVGQRIILSGAHISGGVGTGVDDPDDPDEPVGVVCTYHGLTNGHATFSGNTADLTFLGYSPEDGRSWAPLPR